MIHKFKVDEHGRIEVIDPELLEAIAGGVGGEAYAAQVNKECTNSSDCRGTINNGNCTNSGQCVVDDHIILS